MNKTKSILLIAAPLILSAWAAVSIAGGTTNLPTDCVPSAAGIPCGTVPEPTTLLLLAGGAGIGGLARWLRKRK